MRVALVHDWFQGYHGSERVVHRLLTDVLPADPPPRVFTFAAARELLPADLARVIEGESRLARLPGLRPDGHDPGRWRALLPLMPQHFRSLELRGFDLVLSSSHACAFHARPPADVPHLCYCHTPMRYTWMEHLDSRSAGGPSALALRALAPALRRADRRAAGRVDRFVANSEAVRGRIERFWGREASVVHPPVDVAAFGPAGERDADSFLWVHRLVPYKRPDLVIEAFREMPDLRLTMVGVGPMEAELRASLPANVRLLGWLEREELVRLLGSAAGFVHVGEEDFGISMVEALASGTPVLGFDAGGAREIVRDGVDGILLRELAPEAVRRGVRSLAAVRWDEAVLIERAREFSRERFAERMRLQVQAALGDRR